MNFFIRRFKQIVTKYPDNVAILIDGKQEITYSSLYQKAHNLAQIIRKKTSQQRGLVAISIEKSLEYIVSLLGAWIAEMAFIPIDPKLPQEHQKYIIEETKPLLIIKQNYQIEKQEVNSYFGDDVAYVIFTSGSTGNPKGVIITHKGITNFLDTQITTFQLNSKSRFLFYLSTNFDASISDIGVTLLSGATLCMEMKNNLVTAANLLRIIETRKITHIDLPPSLLSLLDINKTPDTLKTIIIGGEICPVEVVQNWAKKVRLINVYGPTEATVCTSMQQCTSDWQEPSIGKPISNINYQIFDDDYQPVIKGESGELFISGIGLAKGYLNNDILNQEKFIIIKGIRYYRTGDLVKQSKEGNYIYLGRIDRQLKINGQLVAPEEIELKLLKHPLINRVAVIYKQLDNGRKQLIAFVESKKINALSPNLLKYFLKSQLPSWMIPHQIIIIQDLPKNFNGKIDYNVLTSFKKISSTKLPTNFSNDSLVQKLQKIWQQVLELDEIPSTNQHFFDDLGGDSLAALSMIIYAESVGLYLSPEILNNLPTIEDLTRWLKFKNRQQSCDVLSVEVLKEDTKITQEWENIFQQAKNLSIANTNHILLTGATGFLGIHVLRELLVQTNNHIICLIRGKNKQQALLRIENIAQKYNFSLANYGQRIIPIIGDLSLPQLGLQEEQWQHLALTVNTIYHCGAVVNMINSYEQLKPTNFQATQEIIKLACTTTRKKINFASTLSVFVATDLNFGVCYENDCLEDTKFVYGGYTQTKWGAEYFLHQLPSNLVSINIFRLGLITGDSKTGLYSSQDYLALFVKGLLEIGSLPIGKWPTIKLDVTPVDYAAKALVYLSLLPQSKCYHLANNDGFSLQMILNCLKEQRNDLKLDSNDKWLKKMQQKSWHNPHITATYLALCRIISEGEEFVRYRTMDLFQATNIVFNRQNTEQALKESNIVCPQANKQLLEKYLNRILNDEKNDGIGFR